MKTTPLASLPLVLFATPDKGGNGKVPDNPDAPKLSNHITFLSMLDGITFTPAKPGAIYTTPDRQSTKVANFVARFKACPGVAITGTIYAVRYTGSKDILAEASLTGNRGSQGVEAVDDVGTAHLQEVRAWASSEYTVWREKSGAVVQAKVATGAKLTGVNPFGE